MRKMVVTILLMVFFVSCEEESGIPLDSRELDLVVVEAVLTDQLINHHVKLTRPSQALNESPVPVTGAAVTISDGTSLLSLVETPAGSGEYYTPVFRAVAGRTYSLTVAYRGKQFVASDRAAGVEPLQPLRFHSSGNGYELDFSQSGQEPNFIDHAVSWQGTPACNGNASCEGRIIFYDLKTIDVNDIFKPGKAPFPIPKGSVVIRKKFGVSDAYRSFLRSMLSETEWRGGVFDIQRADVPTNLSEGAIGFFAVCSVVTDTTVLN